MRQGYSAGRRRPYRKFVKNALLESCRLTGLCRINRFLIRNKLQIMCYHGFEIGTESRFRQLFTPANTLERHLNLFRKMNMSPIPLNEAVNSLKAGTLHGNRVIITIDDGYYSTYSVAAPVFEKYKCPATVYVSTQYVLSQAPVFFLAIHYMFDFSQVRHLSIRNMPFTPDIDLDLTDQTTAQRIIHDCITYGETHCSQKERDEIACRLSEITRVDYEEMKKSRIFTYMNTDEIRDLSRRGFDIQLHTHTHIFPPANPDTAQKELLENKRILEDIIGKKLEHFCYPDGIWNKSQWSMLDKIGILSSVTSDPGTNDGKSPVQALRRFSYSPHMPEIEFIAGLSGIAPFQKPVVQR